jgi:hypothetical protein
MKIPYLNLVQHYLETAPLFAKTINRKNLSVFRVLKLFKPNFVTVTLTQVPIKLLFTIKFFTT